MATKPNPCDDILNSMKPDEKQLILASRLLPEIINYSQNFSEMARCIPNKKALKEKAYEMETKSRVLLSMALDAINYGYDTNKLNTSLADLKNDLLKNKKPDFVQLLADTKKTFKDKYPEVDPYVFDMAATMIKSTKMDFKADKQAILMEFQGADKKLKKVRINTEPQAGSLGRISKQELFGLSADGLRLFPHRRPLFNDPTVHHKAADVDKAESQITDVYSKLINNICYLKESAYRHARIVEEFGKAHHTGEDPITVLLIIGGAIALTLVIIGLATDNQVALWAGIILGGFILCVVGGCELILGTAVETEH